MVKESWTSKYDFVMPGNNVFLGRSIRGVFAKELLEEYDKFVNKNYKGHPFLKKIKLENRYLTNQNLFSSIVLDKFLRKSGYRAQQFRDLNYLKKEDWSSVENSEFDLGVLYLGLRNIDKEQAEDFSKTLKSKGFVTDKHYSDFEPIFVPLGGLEVYINKKYKNDIGVLPSGKLKPVSSKSFERKNKGLCFYSFNLKGPVFNNGLEIDRKNLTEKKIFYGLESHYDLNRISLERGKILNANLDFTHEFDRGRFWIFKLGN
jgi:hypothetical protein